MNERSTEHTSNRTFAERRALDAATAAELVAQHPGRTSRELATLGGYCPMQVARRLAQAPRVSKGSVRTCEASGRRCLTWMPG
jgi:hypothetical protein